MEEIIGYVIIAAIIFVFFMVNSIKYAKNRERHLLDTIISAYGKRNEREYKPGEFEKIRHYFDYIKNEFGIEDDIDDITWNDVDMDKIYKEMNNTYSSVGEEYLYYLLRKGKNTLEELKEYDELVGYFSENEDKRTEIARIFCDIGRTKSISMFDFIHRLGDLGKRSNIKHYIMVAILIISFVVLLLYPPIGVMLFIGSVTCNVINYYKIKAEVDNYFICFNYLVRLIINSKKLAKLDITEFHIYNKRINELTKDLKNIEKGVFLLPANSVKESLGEIVMEYVRMMFHVDLIKFNSMLKQTMDKLELVDELFIIMGRIESAYAVSSYREMLKAEYGFYAIPEFRDGADNCQISIEAGYHPLINEPVKNTFTTIKPMLLTGSNASGKSTFLKMVAINTILSQTIYTGVCKSYVGKIYSIYSSMSLRDNLSENESYYIVEIKSLKRIVDKIKEGKNIICFVDEVLRGTNTVERISASSELLKYLQNNNVMCFAATHDIELTHILEDSYENYHFEELIENDDVKFNYKLMNGRAKSRNAIKLLGIIGFEKDIIKAASDRSERFLETGSWI